MKNLLILFCLLIATAFAHSAHAAVNLQTCAVTPTLGGLIGCPSDSVHFAPVSSTSLVRSQVNGQQGWRPYGSLQPTDLVVAQSDGSWHALGSLIVAMTPIPPAQPAVIPVTNTWVPMNWTCSIANNVATCTAPVTP